MKMSTKIVIIFTVICTHQLPITVWKQLVMLWFLVTVFAFHNRVCSGLWGD